LANGTRWIEFSLVIVAKRAPVEIKLIDSDQMLGRRVTWTLVQREVGGAGRLGSRLHIRIERARSAAIQAVAAAVSGRS